MGSGRGVDADAAGIIKVEAAVSVSQERALQRKVQILEVQLESAQARGSLEGLADSESKEELIENMMVRLEEAAIEGSAWQAEVSSLKQRVDALTRDTDNLKLGQTALLHDELQQARDERDAALREVAHKEAVVSFVATKVEVLKEFWTKDAIGSPSFESLTELYSEQIGVAEENELALLGELEEAEVKLAGQTSTIEGLTRTVDKLRLDLQQVATAKGLDHLSNEVESARRERDEVIKQLAEAQAKIQSMELTIDVMDRKLDAAVGEEVVETIKAELAGRTRRVEELLNDFEQLHLDAARDRAELSVAKSRVRNVTGDVQVMKRTSNIGTLHSQLEEIREERDQLKVRLAQSEAIISLERSRSRALTPRGNKRPLVLKPSDPEPSVPDSTVRRLKENLEASEKQLEELAAALQEAQMATASSQAEVEESRKMAVRLQADLDAFANGALQGEDRLSAELKGSRITISEITRQLAEKSAQSDSFVLQIATLQRQIEDLRAREDAGEGPRQIAARDYQIGELLSTLESFSITGASQRSEAERLELRVDDLTRDVDTLRNNQTSDLYDELQKARYEKEAALERVTGQEAMVQFMKTKLEVVQATSSSGSQHSVLDVLYTQIKEAQAHELTLVSELKAARMSLSLRKCEVKENSGRLDEINVDLKNLAANNGLEHLTEELEKARGERDDAIKALAEAQAKHRATETHVQVMGRRIELLTEEAAIQSLVRQVADRDAQSINLVNELEKSQQSSAANRAEVLIFKQRITDLEQELQVLTVGDDALGAFNTKLQAARDERDELTVKLALSESLASLSQQRLELLGGIEGTGADDPAGPTSSQSRHTRLLCKQLVDSEKQLVEQSEGLTAALLGMIEAKEGLPDIAAIQADLEAVSSFSKRKGFEHLESEAKAAREDRDMYKHQAEEASVLLEAAKQSIGLLRKGTQEAKDAMSAAEKEVLDVIAIKSTQIDGLLSDMESLEVKAATKTSEAAASAKRVQELTSDVAGLAEGKPAQLHAELQVVRDARDALEASLRSKDAALSLAVQKSDIKTWEAEYASSRATLALERLSVADRSLAVAYAKADELELAYSKQSEQLDAARTRVRRGEQDIQNAMEAAERQEPVDVELLKRLAEARGRVEALQAEVKDMQERTTLAQKQVSRSTSDSIRTKERELGVLERLDQRGGQVASLIQQMDTLQETAASSMAASTEAFAEIEALKSDVLVLKKEGSGMAELHNQLEEARIAGASARKELEVTLALLGTAQRKAEVGMGALVVQHLRNEISQRDSTISTITDNLSTAQTDLKLANEAAAAARRRADTLASADTAQSQDLKDVQNEQLERKVVELGSDLSAAGAKVAVAESQRAAAKRECDVLQEQLKVTEKDLLKTLEEIEIHQTAVVEMTGQLEQTTKQVETLQLDIDVLAGGDESVQEELARLRKQIEEAQAVSSGPPTPVNEGDVIFTSTPTSALTSVSVENKANIDAAKEVAAANLQLQASKRRMGELFGDIDRIKEAAAAGDSSNKSVTMSVAVMFNQLQPARDERDDWIIQAGIKQAHIDVLNDILAKSRTESGTAAEALEVRMVELADKVAALQAELDAVHLGKDELKAQVDTTQRRVVEVENDFAAVAVLGTSGVDAVVLTQLETARSERDQLKTQAVGLKETNARLRRKVDIQATALPKSDDVDLAVRLRAELRQREDQVQQLMQQLAMVSSEVGLLRGEESVARKRIPELERQIAVLKEGVDEEMLPLVREVEDLVAQRDQLLRESKVSGARTALLETQRMVDEIHVRKGAGLPALIENAHVLMAEQAAELFRVLDTQDEGIDVQDAKVAVLRRRLDLVSGEQVVRSLLDEIAARDACLEGLLEQLFTLTDACGQATSEGTLLRKRVTRLEGHLKAALEGADDQLKNVVSDWTDTLHKIELLSKQAETNKALVIVAEKKASLLRENAASLGSAFLPQLPGASTAAPAKIALEHYKSCLAASEATVDGLSEKLRRARVELAARKQPGEREKPVGANEEVPGGYEGTLRLELDYIDAFVELHGGKVAATLARAAGLDSSLVTIVGVREGSVLVDYRIAGDYAQLADRLQAAFKSGQFERDLAEAGLPCKVQAEEVGTGQAFDRSAVDQELPTRTAALSPAEAEAALWASQENEKLLKQRVQFARDVNGLETLKVLVEDNGVAVKLDRLMQEFHDLQKESSRNAVSAHLAQQKAHDLEGEMEILKQGNVGGLQGEIEGLRVFNEELQTQLADKDLMIAIMNKKASVLSQQVSPLNLREELAKLQEHVLSRERHVERVVDEVRVGKIEAATAKAGLAVAEDALRVASLELEEMAKGYDADRMVKELGVARAEIRRMWVTTVRAEADTEVANENVRMLQEQLQDQTAFSEQIQKSLEGRLEDKKDQIEEIFHQLEDSLMRASKAASVSAISKRKANALQRDLDSLKNSGDNPFNDKTVRELRLERDTLTLQLSEAKALTELARIKAQVQVESIPVGPDRRLAEKLQRRATISNRTAISLLQQLGDSKARLVKAEVELAEANSGSGHEDAKAVGDGGGLEAALALAEAELATVRSELEFALSREKALQDQVQGLQDCEKDSIKARDTVLYKDKRLVEVLTDVQKVHLRTVSTISTSATNKLRVDELKEDIKAVQKGAPDAVAFQVEALRNGRDELIATIAERDARLDFAEKKFELGVAAGEDLDEFVRLRDELLVDMELLLVETAAKRAEAEANRKRADELSSDINALRKGKALTLHEQLEIVRRERDQALKQVRNRDATIAILRRREGVQASTVVQKGSSIAEKLAALREEIDTLASAGEAQTPHVLAAKLRISEAQRDVIVQQADFLRQRLDESENSAAEYLTELEEVQMELAQFQNATVGLTGVEEGDGEDDGKPQALLDVEMKALRTRLAEAETTIQFAQRRAAVAAAMSENQMHNVEAVLGLQVPELEDVAHEILQKLKLVEEDNAKQKVREATLRSLSEKLQDLFDNVSDGLGPAMGKEMQVLLDDKIAIQAKLEEVQAETNYMRAKLELFERQRVARKEEGLAAQLRVDKQAAENQLQAAFATVERLRLEASVDRYRADTVGRKLLEAQSDMVLITDGDYIEFLLTRVVVERKVLW